VQKTTNTRNSAVASPPTPPTLGASATARLAYSIPFSFAAVIAALLAPGSYVRSLHCFASRLTYSRLVGSSATALW